jgi:hypothetical protein
MNQSYFLSYHSSDARVARAMQTAMTRRGIAVFDPQDIAPGENFVNSIKRQVNEAAAIIVLMPPSALSPWQLYEVGMADALDKPVFVVGTSDPTSVPVELQDKRFIGLQGNNQKAIDAAADQIAELAIAG